MPGTHILIPCKPLTEGKSRLAVILSAPERFALCRFLLEQTLELSLSLAEPGCIHLLTSDSAAAEIARRFGVMAIADTAGNLNDALNQGRDFVLQNCNTGGLIILPIDLPFADVTALMKMATDCDVTIAGDDNQAGTNLLALQGKAAREFPFGFGIGSFARHRDTARRKGYSMAIILDPALSFDLDEPSDFRRAGISNQLKIAALAL